MPGEVPPDEEITNEVKDGIDGTTEDENKRDIENLDRKLHHESNLNSKIRKS